MTNLQNWMLGAASLVIAVTIIVGSHQPAEEVESSQAAASAAIPFDR